MKSLYTFITEGVLSDIDDTISNGTTYVDVENWLNEHYNINGTYDINVLKNDCIVNVDGDVRMKITRGGYDSLTNGMFRFGTVNGNFDANYQSLKNLEGSPRVVTGKFTIDNNTCEFTCEGVPNKIYGDFDCSGCKSLKSLKGLPSYIEGSLYLPKIDSLFDEIGKEIISKIRVKGRPCVVPIK